MQQPEPGDLILNLARGYFAPRCLHVVAECGIADRIADGPRPLDALAQETGTDPDALARILDLLATMGVFARRGNGYEHTPASRLLRSDHPRSLRSFVRMMGSDIFWSAFGALAQALQTGAPSVTRVFPEGFFAYLRATPELGKLFDEAMTGKTRADTANIMASYDFSRFRVVADIGGGRGHLLQAVLEASPEAQGVLFDLPHVVAGSESLASTRLTFQSGDFFKDPVPPADAYLVSTVIHDWPDEQAIAILRNVRGAILGGGKLLLFEHVVPEGPHAHRARELDIAMLAVLGGRERTKDEYERLLTGAGFRLTRVVQTPGPVSILEAEPAGSGAT
jgi:hypothetical protein